MELELLSGAIEKRIKNVKGGFSAPEMQQIIENAITMFLKKKDEQGERTKAIKLNEVPE